MRKKLAIFTLAVGFFTLCNVVLYTRKLRAEEMTRFWHWSAVVQPLPSNCSAVYGDPSPCGGNASSVIVVMAEGAHAAPIAVKPFPTKAGVAGRSQSSGTPQPSKDHTAARTSRLHPSIAPVRTSASSSSAEADTVAADDFSTFPSDAGGLQSSTWSQRAHFVLDNRTYLIGGVNGSSVTVDVALHEPNRTIRVSLNVSLFKQFNISILEDDAEADSATTKVAVPMLAPMVAPSTVVDGNESHVPRPTSSTRPPKSDRGLTALNEHRFGYLMNVEELCGTTSGLALVILVTTAVNHFAHRKAIRETWGSYARSRPDVRLAFVIGQPADAAVQSAILRESLQFADIVQEDFVDTYKNLSLKTMMLLKWAHTFCPGARFVMKSDDDMFINVPNLLNYIRSLRSDKRQLFGRLVKGARPLRSKSSKYYAPVSEYKDAIYPDYLSGTAYVMSADVAPKLFVTSKSTPIFFLEDVYITGICARKTGIVRRNHAGFVYYKRPVKGCAYYKVISGHNNSPNDLRTIWNDLQNKTLKC